MDCPMFKNDSDTWDTEAEIDLESKGWRIYF